MNQQSRPYNTGPHGAALKHHGDIPPPSASPHEAAVSTVVAHRCRTPAGPWSWVDGEPSAGTLELAKVHGYTLQIAVLQSEAAQVLADLKAQVAEANQRARIHAHTADANKSRAAQAESALQVAAGDAQWIKNLRAKMQRFFDCAEDGEGCDIGRDWFDTLTTLGLLERYQRSPAIWQMTPAGEAFLEATAAQTARQGGEA